MSHLKSNRRVNRRHPNFFQRNKERIGAFFVIAGITCVGISFYIIVFIPDAIISPLPLFFRNLRPVIDEDQGISRLKTQLKSQNINYESVTLAAEGYYLIHLKDGSEVLLPRQGDIKPQLSSLQLILARITMEGKRISRLDLRFEKPVILFK